jgi:hypothetical protein
LWKDVAALLSEGAADDRVIAASARAAERDMLGATDSPAFIEAVRLLLAIPLAARAADFGEALRTIGLDIRDRPGLFELISSVSEQVDRSGGSAGRRSDLGELSARALVSVLSDSIGDNLPGLFETSPADVQSAARKFSWSRGIAELSRAFFGQLVSGALSSWLDRTLALQIGDGRRFADVAERGTFDVVLDQYSRESTRIIQEFAGGWYGKTIHEKGRIDRHDAAVFGAVALKKIVDELRLRRAPDA